MRKFLVALGALLAFFFAVLPFTWAIITSFRTGTELFSPSPWIRDFSWANYISVFREQPFGRHLLNSAVVATLTTLLSLTLSVAASYALARREFVGRRMVLITFLLISMF